MKRFLRCISVCSFKMGLALAALALPVLMPAAHAQFQPGDILVDELGSNRLEQYHPDGTLVRTFSGSGSYYLGVALTPDGNLVTSYNNPSPGVDIFSPSGAQIASFSTPAVSGTGGVSVFADGTLAVSDQHYGTNGSVSYYTQNGTLVRTVAPPGMGDPYGGTVAPDNTLWVPDHDSRQIFHLNEAGMVLGSFNTPFYGPSEIAVSADGTLYVADGGNNVRHLNATGTELGAFSVAASELQGVALATDGNSLYVSGQNGTGLYHYSLTGTLLDSFTLAGSVSQYIAVVPGIAPVAVPEPGAAVMSIVLSLFGGTFLLRRRNRQNARQNLP